MKICFEHLGILQNKSIMATNFEPNGVSVTKNCISVLKRNCSSIGNGSFSTSKHTNVATWSFGC